MRPAEPRNEDFMQQLVAAHPELIADHDGALLLIRREQPIADREDGSGRWSLDHLFVTRGGVPVLVELKRAVDTRLRREVIGQMLDYAANGTAYWQGGRIAESFAASTTAQGRDPDAVLAEFLSGGDPEQFWQQVDANFSAGRIKLVFVADTIPRELARIVEFLNERMKADVRAVELSWFEGAGGITALAPRVIGETERAQTEKAGRTALPPIGREAWIDAKIAPLGTEALAGADVFFSLTEEEGGTPKVASTQGSILATFDIAGRSFSPLCLVPTTRGSVQLCLGYLVSWPAFADEAVRRELYERLTGVVGPLTTRTLNGFPAFPVIKLNNPEIRTALAALLEDVLDAVRSPVAP